MDRTYSDNLQDYKFNQAYTNPVLDGTWPHGLICTIVDTKGNTINIRNERLFLPTLERKHLDKTNIGTITVYNVTQLDIFGEGLAPEAIKNYLVDLLSNGVIDLDDIVFYDGGATVTVNRDPHPLYRLTATFSVDQTRSVDLFYRYYNVRSDDYIGSFNVIKTVVDGEAYNTSTLLNSFNLELSPGEHKVVYYLGDPVVTDDKNAYQYVLSMGFLYCGYMTNVNIPEGIIGISYGAFMCCYALEEVTIPSSIESIQGSAFASCTHLSKVTILAKTPPELGENAFSNTSADMKIYVPEESVAAYRAAEGWSDYADVIVAIPRENEDRLVATYIVEDASNPTLLYIYADLPSLLIPAAVKGVDMFTHIYIDDVEVPIETIDGTLGAYLFTIGEHIVKYTMKDPTLVGAIFVEGSIQKLGATFAMSGITNVILPESVTCIGAYAFSASALKGIDILGDVTEIGMHAFDSASLTSFEIPSGVEILKQGVLYNNPITSIVIPELITSIDARAVTALRITMVSKVPPHVSDLSFGSSGFTGDVIYIPAEAATAYINDSDWAEYAEFFELYDINEDGIVYALFDVSTTENVKILFNGGGGPPAPPEGSITKIEVDGTPITFASTVPMEQGMHLVKYYLGDPTTIVMAQFYSCDITKMWMSDSITTLGDGFLEQNTKLEKVTLSNNIGTIPSSAFYNDTNLLDAIIPESVTSIKGNAFYGCDELKYITLPGVTSISMNAFTASEPKEKVIMGDSVTGMDYLAFSTIFIFEIHTVTPPAFRNSFAMDGSTREIYVPAESVDAYKAASGWSDFASYIQAIPEQ